MKHFLFLLNMVSLMGLAAFAIVGTFQVRVSNHDNPEHAIIVSMILGLVLFAVPAWTIIKYCLCPNVFPGRQRKAERLKEN
jgi:hypothetical protein